MTLGIIDTLVLVAAVIAAIAIGLRSATKTHTVEAFLLGNRDLPWWAILGSIVATETSTATVLSLPGEGFGATGMKFLQIAIGYIFGRTIVVYMLLPLFFDGKLFSAYEVLQKRFGSRVKTMASLLFLVARNLGDGLRLFLAALVLQLMLGWPFWGSAVTIGGVTVLYTYFGGMRSVVWNDCIQLVIYMAGGVVTVFVIANNIPGGWPAIWGFAETHDKLTMIKAVPPSGYPNSFIHWLFSDSMSLWAGLIGGAVLTLGTHGTDQMMVQRYLSARSRRDAAWALFASGLVVFVQFALFLFIGVLLACFYSHQPDLEFERADEIYAHFIVHSFPKGTGLVGLMLAAILAAAMSTLSSSLNSSASAVINDFYLPNTQVTPNADKLLRLTRLLAIGFGILQVGIGIWATTFDRSVVNNALSIAGYSAGLLLGLFALGVLTRRVRQTAAMIGALVGLVTLLLVQFAVPPWTGGQWRVAWPWYALIGSTTTFFAGYLSSWCVSQSSRSSTVMK
ncbi:MAG: sodium/solute symporter [Pirellulaceae bacterium]